MKTRYAQIADWITLDGSRIRELMHPGTHGNAAQSLAEATIEAGGRTLLHRHHCTEELYHVSAGSGWMWLDRGWLRLERGDTVCIAPGSAHCVQADAAEALVLLCCSSPAYSHEDTEILPDGWPATDPPDESR